MNLANRWLGYLLSTLAITAFGMAMLSFAGIVRPGISDIWVAWVIGFSLVAAAVGFYCIAPVFKGSLRGKLWVLVFLLCGAPTATALGFWGHHVKQAMKDQAIAGAHLDIHVAEYLNEQGDTRPVLGDFICGKCVIVDMDTSEISDLQFELPDSLRPVDAAEVGTAVQVHWAQNPVCKYENGATGYQWVGYVRAYDTHQHVVIAAFKLQGSSPPQTTKSTTSDSGTKPQKELIERLETLPVRPLN